MKTKVNAFLHGSMRVMGLAVVAGMMAACETTTAGEETDAWRNAYGSGNAALRVVTRSGDGEATVNYPVHVYVFQGNACKAAQAIGDEGQTLNIALPEGTYSVYAVGGASMADYSLPTEDEATPTTAITLKDGRSQGDLMAAQANVTLTDGEANTVTLGMQRRTMLLQSVVMRKIPTAATAVSVSIAPLWQSITVGCDYSGADGASSLSLEKQGDGRTWQLPATVGESVFLLPPSSSPASITVRITTPSGTRSYTYSTSNELEAGYKINIEGTYTEAVGVSLSGTVTGAKWLGERTIRFDLDGEGSTEHTEGTEDTENDDAPSGNPANFPAAGDTYEGCYVLASTVATDGESAELTLLSPNERTSSGTGNANITLSQLESYCSKIGPESISGWRPMTRSEALLLQAVHTDLGIDGARRYLFDDSGTPMQMLMSNGALSTPTATAAYLRPVVTITVNKE